jgi:hypothetical protein
MTLDKSDVLHGTLGLMVIKTLEALRPYQSVMPGYFETMGIPIVRGRSFQSTDTASSGLVAVVNERFANTFWKGHDPIGQRVKPYNDQPPWFTVVGVAKDVKQRGVAWRRSSGSSRAWRYCSPPWARMG